MNWGLSCSGVSLMNHVNVLKPFPADSGWMCVILTCVRTCGGVHSQPDSVLVWHLLWSFHCKTQDTEIYWITLFMLRSYRNRRGMGWWYYPVQPGPVWKWRKPSALDTMRSERVSNKDVWLQTVEGFWESVLFQLRIYAEKVLLLLYCIWKISIILSRTYFCEDLKVKFETKTQIRE